MKKLLLLLFPFLLPEEQIVGIKEEIHSNSRGVLEDNQGWINEIFNRLISRQNVFIIGDTTYLDQITQEKVHAAIKELLDYEDISSIAWMPASYEGEQEEAA